MGYAERAGRVSRQGRFSRAGMGPKADTLSCGAWGSQLDSRAAPCQALLSSRLEG